MSPVLKFAFVVCFSILLVATALTAWLKRVKPDNKTLANVAIIVRSWWVILFFFLAGIASGPYGLTALFYLVTLLAIREYLKVSRLTGFKLVLAITLIITTSIQYGALISGSMRLFYALVPLMAIWVLPSIVIFGATVTTLPQIFASTFGLMLAGYYLSYVPALALMGDHMLGQTQAGLLAVVILVFLTELNDVFQFLSGKLFGRYKVFPRISPNKTEAGFLGGMILTTGLAILILPHAFGLPAWQSAILGLAISVTGILGDLFFSCIKRYFEIKDFSQLLPGHGGILDRIDSLVLTAPVFFHL